MLSDVFNILTIGIGAVFTWFQDFLTATDMFSVVIGVICLSIFWRLVISPIFMGRLPGGRSDSVKAERYQSDE